MAALQTLTCHAAMQHNGPSTANRLAPGAGAGAGLALLHRPQKPAPASLLQRASQPAQLALAAGASPTSRQSVDSVPAWSAHASQQACKHSTPCSSNQERQQHPTTEQHTAADCTCSLLHLVPAYHSPSGSGQLACVAWTTTLVGSSLMALHVRQAAATAAASSLLRSSSRLALATAPLPASPVPVAVLVPLHRR